MLKLQNTNIFDISDDNIPDNIRYFRILTKLPDCLLSLSSYQRYFINIFISLDKTLYIIPFCFCSIIDARVMLMKNLNIKSKLINDARGPVVGYVIKNRTNKILRIRLSKLI